MTSDSKVAFDANRADVARLFAIHTSIAGTAPGRKRDVAVLNKAAMIFITACWESYVEDVLAEAFGHLVHHAAGHPSLPPKVITPIKKRIGKHAPADLPTWNSSGAGWKDLAIAHMKVAFIDGWNTPKSPQVDEKFDAVLNLPNLTACWYWAGMSVVKATQKLDKFVGVRGDIAHRVHHRSPVHKSWPKDYLQHVARLVELSDEHVRAHVHAATAATPW